MESNCSQSLAKTEHSSVASLSVTKSYRQMEGCFMLKVKKLKVPEKSLEKIQEQYPDVDMAQLQLMLLFRGQYFILKTHKEDFHQLNKLMSDEQQSDETTKKRLG